jgi:predicted cupin superfamily sugar epimerase
MDRRTFVQAAALAGVAALQSSHVAEAQVTAAVTPENPVTPVTPATDMTADEVRTLLNLEPNATCGFVRETYVAKQKLAAGALPAPFEAERPIGSALYFMVTPAAPVKLHRIRNDQLYHYYLGDPLEVLLMRNGGEHVIVGPDLKAGHRVQLLIPGNTFHTARVIGSKRWFLGASTEWPGVIPADVELGKPDVLTAEFPKVAADIRSFPEPVK